ncbi:hypothetical protein Y032_0001g340 [Ancylostoma ceylanicum]|uniref:Uncharacterized protein n=1 Tax=Ancylostoma ceylanicum TaxID=53326 RepID=A0A016W5J0_9BILA|nr:hypothetical protein Y032_0001g340 [Ancylostoma ceylanicum]
MYMISNKTVEIPVFEGPLNDHPGANEFLGKDDVISLIAHVFSLPKTAPQPRHAREKARGSLCTGVPDCECSLYNTFNLSHTFVCILLILYLLLYDCTGTTVGPGRVDGPTKLVSGTSTLSWFAALGGRCSSLP